MAAELCLGCEDSEGGLQLCLGPNWVPSFGTCTLSCARRRAHVVRAARQGISAMLRSSRSIHADPWRRAAWFLGNHGPGSFVKTKAYRIVHTVSMIPCSTGAFSTFLDLPAPALHVSVPSCGAFQFCRIARSHAKLFFDSKIILHLRPHQKPNRKPTESKLKTDKRQKSEFSHFSQFM